MNLTPANLNRAIAELVGEISPQEREWVANVQRFRWSARVIVDCLRANRGFDMLPYRYDWTPYMELSKGPKQGDPCQARIRNSPSSDSTPGPNSKRGSGPFSKRRPRSAGD